MDPSDLVHADLASEIAEQVVEMICRAVASSTLIAPSQAHLVAVVATMEAAATICMMAGPNAQKAAAVAAEYLLDTVSDRFRKIQDHVRKEEH
jgi:hypothetical protein